MIRRTFSVEEVTRATDQMIDEIRHRFDPAEWLSDLENLALVNDTGDVALLQAHGSPGVYDGHYFFLCRGKDAVTAAKGFLNEAFSNHSVRRILGFTPIKKKGAMWLTRHLGFTPLSIETINGEDTQVWTMHKKDFTWVSA